MLTNQRIKNQFPSLVLIGYKGQQMTKITLPSDGLLYPDVLELAGDGDLASPLLSCEDFLLCFLTGLEGACLF